VWVSDSAAAIVKSRGAMQRAGRGLRIGPLETRVFKTYAVIMIGSALGGAARYWCSEFAAAQFGATFPWGTIFVNILGSFVIGFVATISGPDGKFLLSTPTRQFIMIGFCGGYTTFSSFSLQTLVLMREERWIGASANIGLSLFLCLLAVWLGHLVAASLNQLKGA
jgi:CrcB protein